MHYTLHIGFVHFTSGEDGMEAAFRAIDAILLNNIINNVQYICEPSKNLERQVRGVPTIPHPFSLPLQPPIPLPQAPPRYSRSYIHNDNNSMGRISIGNNNMSGGSMRKTMNIPIEQHLSSTYQHPTTSRHPHPLSLHSPAATTTAGTSTGDAYHTQANQLFPTHMSRDNRYSSMNSISSTASIYDTSTVYTPPSTMRYTASSPNNNNNKFSTPVIHQQQHSQQQHQYEVDRPYGRASGGGSGGDKIGGGGGLGQYGTGSGNYSSYLQGGGAGGGPTYARRHAAAMSDLFTAPPSRTLFTDTRGSSGSIRDDSSYRQLKPLSVSQSLPSTASSDNLKSFSYSQFGHNSNPTSPTSTIQQQQSLQNHPLFSSTMEQSTSTLVPAHILDQYTSSLFPTNTINTYGKGNNYDPHPDLTKPKYSDINTRLYFTVYSERQSLAVGCSYILTQKPPENTLPQNTTSLENLPDFNKIKVEKEVVPPEVYGDDGHVIIDTQSFMIHQSYTGSTDTEYETINAG